jgi:tRNA dimethylallyltransferase
MQTDSAAASKTYNLKSSTLSPLVVIVGETASGKSALAMRLAEQFDGEIIAADSRTIYKGMDIGTAKPTPTDQRRVPHHLLNITTPDKPIAVADFKRLAEAAIADVARRGKLPILVGGSGLYIDAVIFDFRFRPAGDVLERKRLSALSVEELQSRLRKQGIPMPTDSRNSRRLIRMLETGGAESQRKDLRKNTLLIGLKVTNDELKRRIRQRVEKMVAAGFAEEVKRLERQYGRDSEALRAPGYKAFREYVAGGISLDNAKEAFIKNDFDLAKKQRTWFKRSADIQWVSGQAEAVDLIATLLDKN